MDLRENAAELNIDQFKTQLLVQIEQLVYNLFKN